MKKFFALLFFGIYFISALAQNGSVITEQEAIQRAIVELHANSSRPTSWIPESTSDRISATFDDNQWFVFFDGETDSKGGGRDGDHMLVILEANGKLNHIWHGM